MTGSDDGTDLVAVRRRKLEALRAAGVDPYPHAFAGVEPVAAVKAPHADLADGEETAVRARVAGRLMARRTKGKLMFCDLEDRSGRIQLMVRKNVLGDAAFDQLEHAVDLGDVLGADGTVLRTRAGELSLSADAVTVLAKSLAPPPDKFHGLADTETRLRRRELDLLSDAAARQVFLDRATIVSTLRRVLDADGFVEVETPVLQPLYGGAAARPFTTHYNALDRTMYLRIATELYLKRCIVGGLERVYEIGKDFRNEGLDPTHQPEFTMLEWYEAYADYHDVADRFERLIGAVAAAIGYAGEIDFAAPWRRVTIADAVREQTGLEVYEHRTLDGLAAAMRAQDLPVPEHVATWAKLLDHLLSTYVEPTLVQPTFLLDYPVELSPFAKRHRDPDAPGLVERFEAYAGGMEIANAFTELNDPDDQRARFVEQRAAASAGDDEAQPFDEAFLGALEQGMPPTGGIGFGIDRLAMLLLGKATIREVVLFPALR